MKRIMLVDDEDNILRALKRVLLLTPCTYQGQRYKLAVDAFISPMAALERAAHSAYDLFIVDYRMPEMDGVTLLKNLRQIQPDAPRIILSGYVDLNGLIGAINEAQIARFIAKPWSDYELVSAIAQTLACHEVLLENQRLADQARFQAGDLSAEALELKRLEALEPGITHVNWGPDGSVILDLEEDGQGLSAL